MRGSKLTAIFFFYGVLRGRLGWRGWAGTHHSSPRVPANFGKFQSPYTLTYLISAIFLGSGFLQCTARETNMAENLLNYARPLSSYGVGGPPWGSLSTTPGSYEPGMPFDSSLARLLGTLLRATEIL